ncbi:MAG: SagB family peptide dehydrogenase [Microcystaceae cyanobacterium]
MLETLELTKVGHPFHEATKHSYLSVMIDPNYVDSSTQPTVFKHYPAFYRRFPLETDNVIDSFVHLTSCISFQKMYREGEYSLRVIPSAGALYPTEIYVQIRGRKGLIDGIYHLEVDTNSLTLIYELIDDGLEAYLFPQGMIKGVIFLISCSYFRSSWKYKNRSLRYCFLDSGHHIGAIEASGWAHQRETQVLFEFDKLALNQVLGLENKEFITACVLSGEFKDKSVKPLHSSIPFVCATDYFEANRFIEKGYQETSCDQVSSFQSIKSPDLLDYNLEHLKTSIMNRRSVRRFKEGTISQEQFREVLSFIQQPLPTHQVEELNIYYVINRVEGLTSGIYLKGQLIKEGDFTEKCKYLCVNQALARDSAVNFLITSDYHNYQTAMQWAGWLGHRLYLISQMLNLQCSGIGAYYDDETQALLETDQAVLYTLAIGQ